MTKKILANFTICLALLFSTSCITQYVWGDKKYEERIEQFFVGADGRYVIFVGDNYHYIFTDNSGVLSKILALQQQNILTIDKKKTHLKLDSNNDISGPFVLEGPFSILPAQDIGTLQVLGFRPDRRDNLSIKINLTGRRYAAKYIGQSTKMSNNYSLSIYYSDSGLVKGMGKAAITPITVTLDAVLLIGKIVVAPLSRDHDNN